MSPAAQSLLSVLVIAALGAGLGERRAAEAADSLEAYVGTYSNGNSKGIYHLKATIDGDKVAAQVQLAAETKNPSFLALHPSGKWLYAVGEVGEWQGQKSGMVTAFARQQDGTLMRLGAQATGGQGPCHVVVDAAGKHALVANYGGGSVASLPIGDDGALGPATSVMQHTGSSVDQGRQKEPHAHSINLDAANRFAVAADLGTDELWVYRFDKATGKLSPNEPRAAKLTPGDGPRHFAFHPGGKFAYVINEMHSTVTSLSYDAQRGTLTPLASLSTLPKDFDGGNSTAEVQVHPSGKFVYGSNRGHDSIAI
ncbi:MAG: lactonase family protein, partial [Planctomycetales bacterium]|nr:lactonase family protein [Planctomycetales bacterium]